MFLKGQRDPSGKPVSFNKTQRIIIIYHIRITDLISPTFIRISSKVQFSGGLATAHIGFKILKSSLRISGINPSEPNPPNSDVITGAELIGYFYRIILNL